MTRLLRLRFAVAGVPGRWAARIPRVAGLPGLRFAVAGVPGRWAARIPRVARLPGLRFAVAGGTRGAAA